MEVGLKIERQKKKNYFLSCIKGCFFLFFIGASLGTSTVFAKESFALQQDKLIVKGLVKDEQGEELIGVTIREKGGNSGSISDTNGEFSISSSIGSTLVFSYVGYVTLEQVVKSSSMMVKMQAETVEIGEVVVTAMGVKSEKKKLNFSVQSVNSDIITETNSANFVSALQGTVSGINVTSAGGSPNSGSQVIIRSISSINPAQSNQPLFVLDGMRISGGGDINPNDIENVTVLKGAAASALYGQEGANGVIMITTKQATVGRLSVTGSVTLQLDNAVRLPKLQSMYGPGVLGFYKPEAIGGRGGWGPMLKEGEQVYDNVRNYFNSGFYQKYDVNMRGGSERFKTYASVNYSDNKGIVVDDYLTKVGALLKGEFDINKYFSASLFANIVNNTSRGAAGVASAYLWPINDDILDYKTLSGTPRFRYLNENRKTDSPISPLWGRYMDSGKSSSTRNLLQASLSLKPIKDLDITGKVSYDQNNYSYDGYSVPRFDDSVILSEPDPTSPYLTAEELASINKNLLGSYSYSQSKAKVLTSSLISTYTLALPADFSLDFLAGAEWQTRTGMSSSIAGRDFIVPGIYSIANVAEINGTKDVSVQHTQRRKMGTFGEIRLDYKGVANLSVSSRWDWSSTLAMEFSPYYYPSVTGGVTFSELFDLSNDIFSYGKLRGNWARVGKDAPSPYLFDRKYVQYPTLPDGGYGVDPSKSVASLLTPEMSDSWEIGLDMRFFKNKTRLDLAYYSSVVDNQIVTVRVSPASGYILQTRNEGGIKNHGIEFSWEQDIFKRKKTSLTTVLNFSLNRGTVLSLPEDIVEIQGRQYGDIFPTAYLHGSTTAISGKEYLKTPDGRVICNDEGYPKINPTKSVVIGNREPDFLVGLSTRFRYRNLTASMLIDARKGGDVVNVTGRGLWSSGQHKNLEFYRGRQIVWDGVVKAADGTYTQNTTPIVLDYQTISNYYTAVSSNFIEDGSYIRLRHVTLGYDLSDLVKGRTQINDLKVSLSGTNLFLLTKYSGSDPQINASVSSGGTGSMGIDNYPVPTTRGFNFTITANF